MLRVIQSPNYLTAELNNKDIDLKKTYSLQNSEIQVIENMGTDIELLCLKIAFKTLCVYNCEGNISCNV